MEKTKIGLQLTPFWPELRCSWECNLLEIIDSNLIQENRPKNAWVIVKDAKGVNKKFRPCPRRMVSRRKSCFNVMICLILRHLLSQSNSGNNFEHQKSLKHKST